MFQKVSNKNIKNDFLYRHTQESTGRCSPTKKRSERTTKKGELVWSRTKASDRPARENRRKEESE